MTTLLESRCRTDRSTLDDMPTSPKHTDPKHTVTVRELNQNTSGVLVRVQTGEELVITSNGRPVARLTPIDPGQDFLDRLVAEGRAIAPTGNGLLGITPWTGESDLDIAALLVAERADEERW